MIPRDYQVRAYDAVLDSLRRGHNPIAAIATGGGKSLLLSMLVDKFRSNGGYSLVLANSKELIVQNMRSMRLYRGLDGIGVYSAGLNHNTIGTAATYGTIQTIYRNLHRLPEVDVVLVDEVQNVAHKNSEAKMYNALMAHFPNARKIGVSATPYRLDKGLVYQGDGCHFDDLAIEITVKELIERGFLTPLKGISAAVQLNLDGVHKTNGDFDTKEVDERITESWLREVLCKVQDLARDRKAILMFTPTVRTAEMAARLATEIGISGEYVHGGDTERAARLKRWEAGQFRLMANCQLLTTGYDNPAIDCIVDCSPTESLGKHIQKLGRGVRNFPGKTDCLVIDVSGNLERLGGISSEADFMKETAGGVLISGQIRKPKEKKPRSVKRGNLIDALDPMCGSSKEIEVQVDDVSYIKIGSKSKPGAELIIVNYQCSTDSGYSIDVSDFVMPEYSGWSRTKSEEWAARRGVSLPRSTQQTLYMCYGLPSPRRLIVKRNGKYFNVLREYF